MGPSIACVLMEYLEELYCVRLRHSTPTLYKRYINDVVGAASSSEKVLQCITEFVAYFNTDMKYIYTILDSTVTFLDIQLTMENNHFNNASMINVFIHTIIFLLIRPSTFMQACHSVFTNLRIKHCCSDNADFIKISNQVANHISVRQYSMHMIELSNGNTQQIHKRLLLCHLQRKFR